MKKNLKLRLVVNPPVETHGITLDNHDFVTVEVSTESLECLAWFMSLVQENVVSEAQVEQDEPGLASG